MRAKNDITMLLQEEVVYLLMQDTMYQTLSLIHNLCVILVRLQIVQEIIYVRCVQ